MKFAEFDYTDLKGKESHRTIVAVGWPTNKVTGFDVSELSKEQAGAFAGKLAKLKAEYDAKVTALCVESDLKYAFRQFFEENMENIEVEPIF